LAKNNFNKVNIFKKLFLLLFVIVVTILIVFGSKILSAPLNIYTIEKGSISYEELTSGYILRDEIVLEGQNSENGLVQIISENERVAKDDSVFRYYSSDEEELLNKIDSIDKQINEEIEKSEEHIPSSSDIISLESQIETNVKKMYKINEIQKINEYKKKLDEIIKQKAKLMADNSSEGSKVRELLDQRIQYENELNSSSEIIKAPQAGLVSYRVDGLEDTLRVDDFDYLNKELLDSFKLKVGSVIPQSNSSGKIIDNYYCYIATFMATEKSSSCKVGDTVKIRLSNSGDVLSANIVFTKDDADGKIIVMQIKSDVESLVQYRRVSFDMIWWSFSGFKIPNSYIYTENDISYINKLNAGFGEKIPVKVERQNETYSIINNYSNEELVSLGFTEEKAKDISTIKLYDQIIIDM
jgi:hypothetical protein